MGMRPPIEIDWKVIAPRINEDTIVECEIAKGNRFFGDIFQKDGDPELFTDQQLDDKITRLRTISLPLSDGGTKLRDRLKALEDEKGRRKRTPKVLAYESSGSQTPPQSAVRKKNDSLHGSASHLCSPSLSSSSSIFGMSYGRLEKPNDFTRSSSFAFSKERSCLNSRKANDSQENDYADKQAQNKCSVIVDEDFTSTSHLSSSLKQSFSSDNPERRRSLRVQNSRDLPKRKIETVILLDEDDDQPVNSVDMEKDEHGWIGSNIYYPSRDHAECVEICYSDMKCLAPCSYLSSPIMNFYIQYLQRVQIETGKARIDYQFFNTYFYNKLEEALAYKGPQDDDSFIKLRRWWKGINIFEKSFIFLPIHSDEHWSLVIICIPAIEDEQGPIIIHLDSLGLHNSKLIFGNVERYLVKEWEHLKDELSLPDLPISYRVWRQLPSKIKSKKIEVPQQDNPYDCGLFVLYFIQRFIEDAPERVRMKDLSMFGRKWFKPEEASRLRQHLKRLLKIQFERVGLLDNARPCTP